MTSENKDIGNQTLNSSLNWIKDVVVICFKSKTFKKIVGFAMAGGFIGYYAPIIPTELGVIVGAIIGMVNSE